MCSTIFCPKLYIWFAWCDLLFVKFSFCSMFVSSQTIYLWVTLLQLVSGSHVAVGTVQEKGHHGLSADGAMPPALCGSMQHHVLFSYHLYWCSKWHQCQHRIDACLTWSTCVSSYYDTALVQHLISSLLLSACKVFVAGAEQCWSLVVSALQAAPFPPPLERKWLTSSFYLEVDLLSAPPKMAATGRARWTGETAVGYLHASVSLNLLFLMSAWWRRPFVRDAGLASIVVIVVAAALCVCMFLRNLLFFSFFYYKQFRFVSRARRSYRFSAKLTAWTIGFPTNSNRSATQINPHFIAIQFHVY